MLVLKKKKKINNSLRNATLISKNILVNGFKSLRKKNRINSGRNRQGKITVRNRGGGKKKLYTIIDNRRVLNKLLLTNIEYDPNRNAPIALGISLETFTRNKYSYIILPKNINNDKLLLNNSKSNFSIGNFIKLKYIPSGTIIHNIEINPNSGGKLCRSSGSHSQLINRKSNKAIIKLNSSQIKSINTECRATIGFMFNSQTNILKLGKAGRNRWKGKKPCVRGVAKNPVDHPHGGRTKGGRPSVTPWGKLTKGKPTRKKKYICI
uniref:Ribosomal protein L2 n=1 Tax=Cyanoptyche gloeocystis TaxID=77922 RepID=A0A096Y6Y2_9EUKA|nr:ribosomal protein L2 [Cyanoptyche gloeocystis]AIM52082.1 ribosomal protein L2 [Cyanoptyche gloeocystis]